jgi:hypothetical protein
MDALAPTDRPTPIETSPLFVTMRTWCALSGMSQRTVFDHIAKGNVVAHKVGGRILINVDASRAWITSQPPPKVRLFPRAAKPRGRAGQPRAMAA